jgi:hypothetical protein
VFEGHERGHVHADRGTLDFPLSDDRRATVLAAARAKGVVRKCHKMRLDVNP